MAANPNAPMLAYMRKSSGEDETGSLDRQTKRIESWATTKDEKLGQRFWEPHVKGSTHWRKRALGEAIAMVERGEASGIVVEEQERLSRENQLQTAELWEALDAAGARLVCIDDGLDTAIGDQELNFGLRALLARDNWKKYAKRSDGSKRYAVERGTHLTGRTPFGYVRNASKLYEIDGAKGPLVLAAFELRATGASYGDVVRFLEGRFPGGPTGKTEWKRNTVTRLLANRVYLGEARGGAGGKYVNANAHPAIVDEQTFDVVQALAKRSEPSTVRETTTSLLHPRCAGCGYALDPNAVVSKHKYLVYRHRGKADGGATCEGEKRSGSIMKHALDSYVEGEILARFAKSTRAVKSRETKSLDLRELHARLARSNEQRELFENPEYATKLGVEKAMRALDRIDDEQRAIESEIAAKIDESGPTGPAKLASAIESWETLPLVERARVIEAMTEAIFVSRSVVRGDVASRVGIVWKGEQLPVALPSRGLKREVEAGVATT